MKTSTLIAAVLLAAAPLQAQSSSDLYQQGLRKERVEGNLPAAIQIYKRVVAGQDRELAARALIRIGEAYEKLGRKEALTAYQRVVRDFADQKEQASAARSHLTELEGKRSKLAATALTVSLVVSDLDTEGRPTVDGRGLTFVDWEHGGNIAIRDLDDGTVRSITHSADNMLMDSAAYGMESTVSHDGKSVAYVWTPPNARGWQPQLRIINLDGTNERVLLANRDYSLGFIQPYDFTSDDRQILIVAYRTEAPSELGFVSTTDGQYRSVRILPHPPQKASLSPDGKWIAYDQQPDSNAVQRDVFVISAADGKEVSRIVHAAADAAPVWSPDGRYVLFASTRGGASGLYAQRMVDGAPSGEPLEIKSELPRGFMPMGFGGQSFFFADNAGGGDIYSVAFANGRVTGPPDKLVRSYEHGNMNGSWIYDTNQLLYMSRRGAAINADGATLVLRNMRTGDEVEFARPGMHPILSRPVASPDGRYAAAKVLGVNVHEMRLIDLQTHAVTMFGRNDKDGWTSFGNSLVWSRDGKSIYYTGRRNDRALLMKYDPASNTSSEVQGFDMSLNPLSMVLSPTGDSLAFIGFRGGKAIISVAPLAGGNRRDIVSVTSTSQGAQRAGLAYSPDGTRIVFGVGNPQALKMPTEDMVEVMSVPVRGGAAEPVGIKMNQVRSIAFAPDGTLTFTAGMISRTEIWRLDNLASRLQR
jgi:Tol biopolymer transport system component